ncbi:DUF1501 domain-containing protein [Aquimarina algicola]|uniref:DUF1501 domain-containing protein n=1 Tax=Aquimarina algicola TaxID=2589995 RepID=A0A504IYW8_9FLAO|nr:DUF1501 domain-containing protein [Aquimarina algicola]TPN81352.1 DUF1501 domain-containing protein [Aquimarina algicola]
MCNIYKDQKKGSCNHHDHKEWSRRSFVKALGIVGGGSMALANTSLTVSQPSLLEAALNQSDNDRVLVLIRLKGGNDGLNTIIPYYDYDNYARVRETIRIKEDQLFKLNTDFAMPKYANDMQYLWDQGQMKVIHGVGYENSSRSHFTGSDIWATADINDVQETGWAARYFENIYPDYLVTPPDRPAAIQIGNNGNLIFDGTDTNFAFSVSNPDQLAQIAENGVVYDLNGIPDNAHGRQVQYLKGIANTTIKHSEVINQAYEKTSSSSDYSSDSDIAKQLRVVSRLIRGNLKTKIYLVTIGSFDTHNNQSARHSKLMEELSNALSVFYKELNRDGWGDKVLSMTISEFGRRVEQNGSGGTDHGTAAPVMIFGGELKGDGFVGNHPDLNDLGQGGNLKYNQSFVNIYSTIMKKWLCVPDNLVDRVLGQHPSLDLGFDCPSQSSSSNNKAEDQITLSAFEHKIIQSRDQPYLYINNDKTGHIVIKIYNMMGQEVGVLKNEMMFEGEHKIYFDEISGITLDTGQYLYRIDKGGQKYSKLFMVQ